MPIGLLMARGCHGKARHDTRERAEAEAQRIRRTQKHKHKVSVYACPCCGGWHVGSRRKGGRQIGSTRRW